MRIYKISQTINNNYDTYDSAIVVAKNEEQAKRMHPNGYEVIPMHLNTFHEYNSSWVDNISEVTVEYIGKADKQFNVPKIICASFNAG